MDKLKKYLQENQEALDGDMPGDAVWQRIQQSAKPVKTPVKTISVAMRYAAAACVIGAMVAGVFFLSGNQKKNTVPSIVQLEKKDSQQPDTVVKVLQVPLPKEENEKVIAKAANIKKQRQVVSKNAIGRKNKSIQQNNKSAAPQMPANTIADELSNNYAQLVNLQLNRLRITPLYAEDANYFNDFKMQLKQMDEDEAVIKKDIKVHGLNDVLLQQLINIYQQKLNVLKNLQTEINKMNNQVKQKQLPTDSVQNHFINI